MAAFDALKVLLLHFLPELPLALQREHSVLEGDVDVLTLHLGELRLQHHLVRVGLPQWTRRLKEPLISQVTRNIIDLLRGQEPKIR